MFVGSVMAMERFVFAHKNFVICLKANSSYSAIVCIDSHQVWY